MKLEGIFVLYQDTGILAPIKVDAFIERLKNRSDFKKLESKNPGWKLVVIPAPQQMTELASINLTTKGVIVFYINIGSRSPSAAESFIEKIRKEHSWLSDLPQSTMFIPIRNQNTYVDYLNLEEESNVTSKNHRT